MLPQKNIEEFRETVREELLQGHGIEPPIAGEAIRNYRAIAVPKTGEMTCHRDPDSVALTVAQGWNSGFLKPPRHRWLEIGDCPRR